MLLKQVSSVTSERMAIEKTCKEHEIEFVRYRQEISQLKQELSATKIELKESENRLQHEETKNRKMI